MVAWLSMLKLTTLGAAYSSVMVCTYTKEVSLLCPRAQLFWSARCKSSKGREERRKGRGARGCGGPLPGRHVNGHGFLAPLL